MTTTDLAPRPHDLEQLDVAALTGVVSDMGIEVRPGEYQFHCQMVMLRGTLVVR